MQVKGNQKLLHFQLKMKTLRDEDAVSVSETTITKRGRIECRKVFVFNDIKGISREWAGLMRIIRVERYVTLTDRCRHDTAYYITSIRRNSAAYFADHIQNHWGIENRLHWVKDVIMKEDTSRTAGKMAAENISIMRNIVINIIRVNGYNSIKKATELYSNNIKGMMELILCKPKRCKRT